MSRKKSIFYQLDKEEIRCTLFFLVLILSGLALCFSAYYVRKQNKEEQQMNINKELCKPLFFLKKKLIAQNLYKVTCIDKNGKSHIKYKEAKLNTWKQ